MRWSLGIPRSPLLLLLAVNLAAGVVVAVVAVAGLLAFDLHGLRRLIAVDSAPQVAIGLLLFGFVITFGSVVMGAAVMMLGSNESKRDGGPGAPEPLVRRSVVAALQRKGR